MIVVFIRILQRKRVKSIWRKRGEERMRKEDRNKEIAEREQQREKEREKDH